MKKIIVLLLTAVILTCPVFALADGETYAVWISDDADLLTPEEETKLRETMEGLLPYGHVLFYSTDVGGSNAGEKAGSWYRKQIGQASGMLLMVDMKTRKLYIHSDGDVYKTITKAEAYNITDNVYRMASRGEYYSAADTAFSQAAALLRGESIARPMKIICNILLALWVSVLTVALILRRYKYNEAKALRKQKKDGTGVFAPVRHRAARQIQPGNPSSTSSPADDFIIRNVEMKVERKLSDDNSSGGDGFIGGGGDIGELFSGGGGGHGF